LGLSHVAVQFPIYEALKVHLRSRHGGDKLQNRDLVVSAAVSKLCGVLLTYPHEVLRARLQDQRGGGNGSAPRYNGIVDCCRQIARNEGIAGFYAGLQLNLVRVVPACIITFTTYELLVDSLK
jgi:solute carrier family 25 folate transporter 32